MRLFYPIACALAVAAVAGTLYAQSTTSKSTSTTNITVSQQKYSFAIVNSNGTINCSGSWDSSEFEALKKRSKEMLLYVRKEGVMYVIEDKPTIQRVQDAFKPLMEIGKMQGETGKEQGEFGSEMGEYGRQMGELGRQMGEIGSQMGSDSKKNEELSAKMKELQEKQKELSQKMRAVGEKAKEMGKKQSEWGKKMSAAAKEAHEKSVKLIDQAFDKGLAKKV